MTLESSYTLRPDGFAPIPREQAATVKFPDGQQTQTPSSDRIPEPTWESLKQFGTARSAMHPSIPKHASGISFNKMIHEKNIFSPSQTTILPRAENPGPNSMQDQRPHHTKSRPASIFDSFLIPHDTEGISICLSPTKSSPLGETPRMMRGRVQF